MTFKPRQSLSPQLIIFLHQRIVKRPYRFRWMFLFLLLWSGCDSAEIKAARIEKLKSEIEEKRKSRADLEMQIAEASDLEAWTLSSMPLQPLVIAIIRSMEPGSEIVRLQLERDAETPSQLRMRLVLNTASDKQLERTLQDINALNFRESNQAYTRSDGQFVYTTRLLWKDPQSQSRQTPEQRQNSSASLPLISKDKAKGVDPWLGKERAEEGELQIQLGLEQELLTNLQQQSADLLNFVAVWKPYFALVDDQQAVETGITMRVREGDLLTLSQRYKQVPHKIANEDVAFLPTLMRATLVFDDNYEKLLNWLGSVEKIKPTMRVGKLDLTKGSRGGDLRMELTLEVPLLRSGS